MTTPRTDTKAVLAAAAAALAVVLGAAPARAEDDGGQLAGPARGTSAVEPPAEMEDLVAALDADTERRVVGLWRARVSEEQVFAAGLGLMVVRQPRGFDCTTTCEYRGLVVQLDPGLGAGQLAIGHGVAIGELRRGRTFLAHTFFAHAIKGAVLHTWSDDSSLPPGQTYAGVEAELTAVMVNFSLGLFRHVSGGQGEDRWIVTAGLGYGF